MPNPRLATRYAKSLLDLAIEQNSVDATLQDMQLLDSVCRQSREFVVMLRSPIIKADKKQHVVEALVSGKAHPLTSAFIKLLVNKGREGNLPEIASAFIAQYKTMKNIKTAKLSSAVPMSDKVKELIRGNILAAMPGVQLELKEEIRPELIGGFVLQIDDKLVDASVRRDLNDVKAQFLKNMYESQLR
jgi:F-type H+-transporting ATPase subunit delta